MDLNLQQHFRDNLASALRTRGMTQSALARLMNISPQTVGDYYHGRKSPGLEVVERFAHALGLNPMDLLTEPASQDLMPIG